MTFMAAGGFSAFARRAGRSTDPDQYSGEVAVDLAWSDQSICSGMLPGKANLAHEWTGQPQLPARGGDQPAPTVSRLRVAGADGSPAESLFEEAEGMLDREAS